MQACTICACVRAPELDWEMYGGCWTLRWDIRGRSVGRAPRLNEACRLDESCPSGSDMYARPLWRRGFEIRSARPRLLVPPWQHGSTDEWAVRHGNSNLAALQCRLKFRPLQDLSAGMPSRQQQKRRARIPPLVLRLLPEGRRRRWLANQSTSPAAYCTTRRIRPSCFGFKFCMPGPRRSSNLVPILGTLIDVRGSTFELALQIDRSVPPGTLVAVLYHAA